jgi:hypothetical protein
MRTYVEYVLSAARAGFKLSEVSLHAYSTYVGYVLSAARAGFKLS